MKKILLGTSALVAFGLLATPAAAELTLKISGNVEFGFGGVDDDANTDRDYDFASEGALTFAATGTADNGLTYGATIKLADVNQADDIVVDETYITLGGTFGTVILGDDDGAGDQLLVTPPDGGTGAGDNAFTGMAASYADFYTMADDTSDATKITYLSPVFNGFTAGISFTPDSGEQGDTLNRTEVGPYTDVVELGAKWTGTFGETSVSVGGQYHFGDAIAVGAEDLNAWGVGATVGFGAFSVGASYIDNNDSGSATDQERHGFNVGASYEMGAWSFGATYHYGHDDEGDSDTAYGVGASYTVAPGLVVAGDLAWFDDDDATAADSNDGVVYGIRTKVSF